MFIRSYHSILEAKGYLKNIEKTKEKIADLREDKKVAEADKLSSEMSENIQNAFSFYESILTSGSRGDWSQIMIDVCHTPVYNGESTTVLRPSLGKSNLTLSPCLKRYELLYLLQNGAFLEATYLCNSICKPEWISVRVTALRLKELNGHLKYFHSKHAGESMNKPLTKSKMCAILLQTVPTKWESDFWFAIDNV